MTHTDWNKLKQQVLNCLNTENVLQSLTNICELLQKQVPHYDWVGFYFAQPDKKRLLLKAYAGEATDHTEIPFGKGICGQVALSNQKFLVPDVHAQDNYIACSINVKSEIVIPLFWKNQNVGQIDIDSHTPNAFSTEDEAFLEWVNLQLVTNLEFEPFLQALH